MNQKLTFTAFLQDEYSKKFDQLAGRSDANIKKIEKDLQKFGRTGKQVTRNIDDLNKRIDVLTRVRRMTIDTRAIKYATAEIKKLQREKDKLEGTGSGRGGGTSVFNIAGGIGVANIASRGLGAIRSFVSGSAEAYMNYEAIVEQFKVLTKSDTIGTGLAERLNKWQQDTILGPEVFKSAQTLLSFGISIKDVEKDLLALGNISQGNADRLASLTLAFAQTQSAGKLMGQDLLQYVNAGFNPLQTMVERWQDFGFKSQRSMGQLRKDMQDGTISSDMIRKAFQLATTEGGLFAGMLEKVGKTSFGQKKQLEGQYEALKIATGERYKRDIDNTIGGLSSLVAIVKKWVEVPLSEKIQKEANSLSALQAELNTTNISEDRRHEILDKLNSQYGITLKNIGDEKQAYTDLNGEINKVITSLENKAIVTRTQENLKDVDDRIAGLINVKADAFIKAFEGAGNLKRLDKDAVKALRMNADLTNSQKIAQLSAMGIEAGYSTTSKGGQSAYDVVIADQLISGYDKSLDYYKKVREEKKKIADEAESEFGVFTTGSGRTGRSRFKKKKGLGVNDDGPGTSGGGTSMPSISGSSKITHLVINIDSLLKGGVNIYKATAQEGATEMKNVVTQQLLTAVNDANLVVGK